MVERSFLGAAFFDNLRYSLFALLRSIVLTDGDDIEGEGARFGIGLIADGPPPEQRPRVGAPDDAVSWLIQKGSGYQMYEGVVHDYSGPRWVNLTVGALILPTPPFAFVQAHPEGRLQMHRQAMTWAGRPSSARTRAVDLGSGTGFFARGLAALGWQVDAVEPSPHARHAWSTPPAGIEFHALGAEEFAWPQDTELVILDPPRSGMKPEWMAGCLAARPQRILAVHCGQAAAKRDLTLLRESGYKPQSAVLVNLFPGSPHGELMSLWERS